MVDGKLYLQGVLEIWQVQDVQNLGSHIKSACGQDLWSKLAFRGECKPKNSWVSKCYGAKLRPPYSLALEVSFAIFDEGLVGKSQLFCSRFVNILGDFRSNEPLFKRLLEEGEF